MLCELDSPYRVASPDRVCTAGGLMTGTGMQGCLVVTGARVLAPDGVFFQCGAMCAGHMYGMRKDVKTLKHW